MNFQLRRDIKVNIDDWSEVMLLWPTHPRNDKMDELRVWLVDNFNPSCYVLIWESHPDTAIMDGGNTFYVAFKDDVDMMAYKLRWE